MPSPTSRTLAWLRDRGWIAAITEHWNPHARVRQDLFGFLDLVALDPEQRRICGVQTTSTPNLSARISKIKALPAAQTWSECGALILVIGWAKRGPRGERKVWTPKVVSLKCLKGAWWEFDEPL